MKTLNKTDYEKSFIDGLSDVLDHKQGKKQLQVEKICIPVVNAQSIRSELEISQQEFSTRFGIPLATVKNWEQGRREPDQPTSILLYLISKFPDQIASELKKLRSRH